MPSHALKPWKITLLRAQAPTELSNSGIPLAAFSRAVSGPRGVGEPVHARDLFMLRTGRSHDRPIVVMVGRVVRGTLRR